MIHIVWPTVDNPGSHFPISTEADFAENLSLANRRMTPDKPAIIKYSTVALSNLLCKFGSSSTSNTIPLCSSPVTHVARVVA